MITIRGMEQPNTWSSQQAAEWAGINHRLLLDFLDRGLLPGIPVGKPQIQRMSGGTKRRRRVGKWLVPTKAFIAAWENFSDSQPRIVCLKNESAAPLCESGRDAAKELNSTMPTIQEKTRQSQHLEGLA